MIESKFISKALFLRCSDCGKHELRLTNLAGAVKHSFAERHKNCGKEKSDLRKHIEVLNEK